MKRVFLSMLLLGLTLIRWSFADTGTYQILDYQVRLVPHSDGTVEMNYYQKWKVTDGHIPWITVGLPNENFTIKSSGQAIKKIAPANESGWCGVRIDLNKDYQPNETFEISFSIVQTKLFYADEKNYKLDFTPGWYDRAFTDNLLITVKFFAKVESVKANPPPKNIAGEEMSWQKSLGKGEKFKLSLSFPKKLFPEELKKEVLESQTNDVPLVAIIVLIIILILFVIFVIIAVSDTDGGSYSGGSIFYGGSSGGGSGRETGGGGGFGGRSSSCACACVSCACACACAGGGGAGCTRKTEHNCPVCQKKGGIVNDKKLSPI